MKNPLTDAAIDTAMRRFGLWRVREVQKAVVGSGLNEFGFISSHMFALGLRETGLQNLIGGGSFDKDGKWITEKDPRKQDVGWLQFNRFWHAEDLKKMQAVKPKTWGPIVKNHNPYEDMYVPTFTDALNLAISDALALFQHLQDLEKVPAKKDQVRIVLAAHNAGPTGALNGYNAGDIDKETTHADYSAWCVQVAGQVHNWFVHHDTWVL